MTNIDWNLISRAIDFYCGVGFKYVDVPWIVSKKAIDATIPQGRRGFSTDGGVLVGSAEQSFIEMMINGDPLDGRFVTASPCFRDDEVDETHQRWFFKVELFVKMPHYNAAYQHSRELARLAQSFFLTLGETTTLSDEIQQMDVNLNGIEVGSYGARTFEGHYWTYGTGIAEPRFTCARSHKAT